jgi:hypothetical protein
MSEEKIQKIFDTIWEIETLDNLSDLMKLMIVKRVQCQVA